MDTMPPAAMPAAPMPPAMPAESMKGEEAPPMAPPPPADGYSERSVRDLLDALGMALKAMTKAMGREAPALPEPPKDTFVKGKMMSALPSFLVQEVAMILSVAAQLGGKVEGRYDVDVAPLFENDPGLEKLAVLLELVAKDKVLLSELKEAQKAGGKLSPKEEKMAMAEGKKEAKYGDKDSPEHEAAESPAYEAAEERGAKSVTDYM